LDKPSTPNALPSKKPSVGPSKLPVASGVPSQNRITIGGEVDEDGLNFGRSQAPSPVSLILTGNIPTPEAPQEESSVAISAKSSVINPADNWDQNPKVLGHNIFARSNDEIKQTESVAPSPLYTTLDFPEKKEESRDAPKNIFSH
jgi:hypothetical protein